MAIIQVIFDRLPDYMGFLSEGAQQVIDDAADHIAAKAQDLIETSPGGGRVYHGHQASAPGQPPASDTGELVGSITAHPHTAQLQSEVHATSGHAIYLEFGTSKMVARPFMAPAVEDERPKLIQAMGTLLGQGTA